MNENAKDKVSIIIPVYNVQLYLDKCFESILAQTYANFEVICIDDGSTDESGRLCDFYQEKDNRIKVYHIENHGVGYARNYGLSMMNGDWFCFVDPDDWIEPIYIERMHELACENRCDVVACNVDKTYEYVMGIEGIAEQIYFFETSRECIRNFICDQNSMHGISCNKLYRAEIFKGIRFNEKVRVNEDCLYIYEVMSACSRACLTTLPLYHWYIRPDSACHRKAERADFSAANVFLSLCEKVQDEDMAEARTILRKNYISSAVQVLLYANYEKKDAGVALAKERCKQWKKEVWNRFNVKQKMKYWYAIYLRKVFL